MLYMIVLLVSLCGIKAFSCSYHVHTILQYTLTGARLPIMDSSIRCNCSEHNNCWQASGQYRVVTCDIQQVDPNELVALLKAEYMNSSRKVANEAAATNVTPIATQRIQVRLE